jgi:hypothetical protein
MYLDGPVALLIDLIDLLPTMNGEQYRMDAQ